MLYNNITYKQNKHATHMGILCEGYYFASEINRNLQALSTNCLVSLRFGLAV